MKALMSLILVLFSALSAIAIPNGDFEYIFGLGGRPMGSESFHVESFGDTLVMEGRTDLTIPRPLSYTVRTLVHLPDLEFVSSRLISETGDTVLCEVEDSLLNFEIRGSSTSRQGYPIKEPRIPLDNGVAQHLWLLAQRRELLGMEEGLTVLVPQARYFGPLSWRETTMAEGYLDGELVPLERQAFSISGLLCEIDVAEGGELMAYRVPLQNLELKRPGFLFSGVSQPDSSRFTEIELEVEGGGPPLGGTLTLPEGEGPFPGVVFLHGSGPLDRNETLGPNRIFWDIAQGLAEKGIASFRYDKRTWVYNQQASTNSMTPDSLLISLTLKEEVLEDAEAAFKLMSSRPEIDADRCFILGHSLGAMAAPIVSRSLAQDTKSVKGLVLLASPARDMLTLMEDQFEYLDGLGSLPEGKLEENQYNLRRIREGMMGQGERVLGAYLAYWESVMYERPQWNLDAQQAPALFLFGDRDYQVSARDREIWQNHLGEKPGEHTRMEVMPGLNHLFLEGEGKPSPEEYGIRGKVGPEVIDTISHWILDLP